MTNHCDIYSKDITLFQHNHREQWCICSILAWVWTFCKSSNWDLAFATIHDKPFPFLHYHENCDLQSTISRTVMCQFFQNLFLHSCWLHIHPWNAGTLTGAQMSGWPLMNALYFLTCFSCHHHITCIRWQWIFMGEISFTHNNSFWALLCNVIAIANQVIPWRASD